MSIENRFLHIVEVEINGEKEKFCREVWENITRDNTTFPADTDSAIYLGISDLTGLWSDVVPVQSNGCNYSIDAYYIPAIVNGEYFEEGTTKKYVMDCKENSTYSGKEYSDYNTAFNAMARTQDNTLKKLGVIVPYIRNKAGELKTSAGAWLKVELTMYTANIIGNNFKQELKIREV